LSVGEEKEITQFRKLRQDDSDSKCIVSQAGGNTNVESEVNAAIAITAEESEWYLRSICGHLEWINPGEKIILSDMRSGKCQVVPDSPEKIKISKGNQRKRKALGRGLKEIEK
jgi:hypothetical protein